MSKESHRTGVIIEGHIEPIEPASLSKYLSVFQMGKELYQRAEIYKFTQEQLDYVAWHISEILDVCDMLTDRYVDSSQN